ncbi:hypothetical protein [Sphingobium boeckii]|uniref:Transposase-like protein n=1 Tax=Sphingobium boeckii TaxID=1082345 RepID=A0A7W9AGN2_9SPHN|nr:hypothetical protein [Sphingobium boeckii]MBB5685182.1 transposase-like protein [Sphingobium boeckii]
MATDSNANIVMDTHAEHPAKRVGGSFIARTGRADATLFVFLAQTAAMKRHLMSIRQDG